MAAGALIEKGAPTPGALLLLDRWRASVPAAVIPVASSIERHAEVDCGTVVEIPRFALPPTWEAGLDLEHSVSPAWAEIVNLRRDVTVTIADSQN